MQIRRLVPSDAEPYRLLMLHGYAAAPDAFTSTVAERESLPLSWWQARVADRADADELVMGTFDEAMLVGVAGLARERRTRTAHKATLFGMYVQPAFRGRQFGRALVHAVLARADAMPATRIVQLTVTDTNTPAVRLYASCGFVPFGTEPYAVRVDDRFVAKIHMWCPVGAQPA
jgi:GNAT superfamily N-acetyltransferase